MPWAEIVRTIIHANVPGKVTYLATRDGKRVSAWYTDTNDGQHKLISTNYDELALFMAWLVKGHTDAEIVSTIHSQQDIKQQVERIVTKQSARWN